MYEILKIKQFNLSSSCQIFQNFKGVLIYLSGN